MKSLFVFIFFSFLLTFTADIAAQEVKQNPATAAKMPSKTAATGGIAPKVAAASVSKPAVPAAKKVKKVVKATEKPASKGLFDDDYDGDVGIKYIGTEPASDEELSRVREVERNSKPVKSASKNVTTPPASSEKAKTKAKEAKMETSMETPKVIEAPVEVVKVKEVKREVPVEVVKVKEVKEVKKEAPVEVVKVKEVKKEAPVEVVKVKEAPIEVKVEEIPEVKVVKPVVKPASKSTVRGAHAEFDAVTIDLGTLKEDAVVERYFDFTNTGSSPLEIIECRGSCGCIQPKAESTTVGAGERSRIYVKYVARNKVGPQKPVVTLTTNGSPSVIRLFIETWVDQIPGGVKDTTPTPVKSENNY